MTWNVPSIVQPALPIYYVLNDSFVFELSDFLPGIAADFDKHFFGMLTQFRSGTIDLSRRFTQPDGDAGDLHRAQDLVVAVDNVIISYDRLSIKLFKSSFW